MEPKAQGGDPSLLWDNELDAISAWVAAGKGVIVMEVSDYGNYDYCRVSNRILDNLGFGWWFQHDTINDATHNDLATSYKPLVVRVVGNEIGDNYASQAGVENILAYKCPTLIPRPTITATVDVSHGENDENTTVTVPVIITNTGSVWDNFSLSASDNKGWTLSLSTTSTGILNPNDNAIVNLTVTLPLGTGGQIDNVTVTAKSFDNGSNFSGSGTVTSIVRGVSVSISPSYENGPNGATLTYTVTATNTGNVSDNYSLTVSDNDNWGSTVSPTSLTVPAGENRTATLSVTIPSNAIVGTSDTITVTATSRTDNTVNASDSCTAQATAPALPPAAGVTMSISSSSQSGTPGTTLVYTMSITNTGGATDTFDLGFSGGAGWSPSISLNSLTLAAGTPGGVTLTVTVPSGAAAGASTTITVTATSRADPSVSASASCTATASAAPPAGAEVTPPPTEAAWPAILAIAAAIVIIILSLSFILL